MRAKAVLLTAVVLFAASCTGSGAPAPTADPSSTSSTATARPPSSTTSSSTSTSTTTLAPDPLTARPIGRDLLTLMPLATLPAPFGVFRSEEPVDEPNDVTIARAAESADEAQDIERFGRVDGVRTVHRAGALVSRSAQTVDTWIALFEDDTGASRYLADYTADVVKGVDVGHGGALFIVEATEFVVDEVGAEAIGLRATAATATTLSAFYETIVGFRVGRLLGFVSVVREDDADTRIVAQRVAQAQEERMRAVLAGTVTPPPIVEVPQLAAYAFSFEQSITESFLQVIYPEDVVDFGGEGEDPGDTTTTTSTSSSTTSTTEAPGSTSSTSTSSTTTTTLLVPTTELTAVAAAGVVVEPDRLDCRLQFISPFGAENVRYVVVAGEVWKSSTLPGLEETEESEFVAVDPAEEAVDLDLIFCPGWSPSITDAGLAAVIEPGLGAPDVLETLPGIPLERFDLDRTALETMGLIGADVGPVSLDGFRVWIDPAGPWIVGVDLDFSGTATDLEPVLGPSPHTEADVGVSVRFRLTSPNDSELVVTTPE